MRKHIVLTLLILTTCSFLSCSKKPQNEQLINQEQEKTQTNDLKEDKIENPKDSQVEKENLFKIENIDFNINNLSKELNETAITGEIKNTSDYNILLIKLEVNINSENITLINYEEIAPNKTSILKGYLKNKDNYNYIERIKYSSIKIIFKDNDNKLKEFFYKYNKSNKEIGIEKDFISLNSEFNIDKVIYDKNSFKEKKENSKDKLKISMNGTVSNENNYEITEINDRYFIKNVAHILKSKNLKSNEKVESNIIINNNIYSPLIDLKESDFKLGIKHLVYRANSDNKEFYDLYYFPNSKLTLIERIEKIENEKS